MLPISRSIRIFDGKRQEPTGFERRPPAIAAVITEVRSGSRGTHRTAPSGYVQRVANELYSAGGGGHARWAGHIVSVDGRPAVVTAMTIVPNIDMSLLKGTPNLLLSINYIDDGLSRKSAGLCCCQI